MIHFKNKKDNNVKTIFVKPKNDIEWIIPTIHFVFLLIFIYKIYNGFVSYSNILKLEIYNSELLIRTIIDFSIEIIFLSTLYTCNMIFAKNIINLNRKK